MNTSFPGSPGDREESSSTVSNEIRTARTLTLRLFSLLLSVRVAVVLLLLLVLATAAGALIPQQAPGVADGASWGLLRAVGLDAVFDSWWYTGLLVAVAAQTALCTASRSRIAWVQLVHPTDYRPEGSPMVRVSSGLSEAAASMSDLGYRAVGRASEESGAVFVRGRLQPLGFLVLHVGLVVLIAGSIWNLHGSSVATLLLPPGERVLLGEIGRQLELRDLRAEFAAGRPAEGGWEPASLAAEVRVYQGTELQSEGTVALGDPLRFRGGELVLLPVLDRYQVTLAGTAPSGRRVTGRLRSDAPELDLGGADGLVAVVADFVPDGRLWSADGPGDPPDDDGLPSGPLRHPLATVQLVGREDGMVKAAADLEPGETLAFAAYSVTFVEAGYVPVAVVSSTAGRPLLIVGALASILGLLLSLGFSFRMVWLKADTGGVTAHGFARRHHQPLAEELAMLSSPPADDGRPVERGDPIEGNGPEPDPGSS